jgi:competence protein ComEA
MPDLERAEKYLIIFLTLTLLLGAGVLAYLKSRPPAKIAVGRFPADKPLIGSSTAPSMRININEASAEELVELKGIGKALAERIIGYRSSNGRFITKEGIKAVKGIGSVLYEKIKDDIAVE